MGVIEDMVPKLRAENEQLRVEIDNVEKELMRKKNQLAENNRIILHQSKSQPRGPKIKKSEKKVPELNKSVKARAEPLTH